MKHEYATTPTAKFTGIECKNCIHFWFRSETTAKCTHPNMSNKEKKITLFNVCDYYEE